MDVENNDAWDGQPGVTSDEASVNNPEQSAAPVPEPVSESQQSTADEPLFLEDDLAAFGADAFEVHQIPWSPNDYPGYAWGKTAHKLHSSAVAPIVVAARGYRQVTEDGLSTARQKFGLPGGNVGQGIRLREAAQKGDVLIMPWYTPNEVVYAQTHTGIAEISAVQYRPESPSMYQSQDGKPGREAKYEFAIGEETVVGLHPSTPGSWLDVADTFIVAEGLLKADSLISAMLVASAEISDEDLLINPDPNFDHQAHLRHLLSKVEPEYRIPILGIAGVYNWAKRPEWNTLRLKEKEVWVAIDGDVATNPNVHLAATRFWDFLKVSMKSTPKLLAPEVVSDGETSKKMGVDDFLFEVGNYARLLTHLSSELPPKPKNASVDIPGEWRIEKDGTSASMCTPVTDATGTVIGHEWREKVGLGGRIKRISESRFPTKQEELTGKFNDGVLPDSDETEVEVVVEVSWQRDDGIVETADIVGPHSFLNYNPDQWARNGASVPYQVTIHPEWPPRGRATGGGLGAGEGWLRAVKKHRGDETIRQVVWQRMGWVPVRGSNPAFIVGQDVLYAEETTETVHSGVTEKTLANADQFGVGAIDPHDFRDEAYRAKVSEHLREVVKTYIESGAWSDRGVAGLSVATALRPCIPVRPKGTVFIAGTPGKGKSWTAAAIMGFWCRTKGSWGGDSLPGSSGDTAAATELAMSRAPIWIVDDYHPTTDGRKAMMMHDKIADIVRYQFNGVAKRRATNTMGSMSVFPPNSALLITGENELNVASVRQRLVTVDMRDGALHPERDATNAIEALYTKNDHPSQVTQGLIKYLQWRAKYVLNGWEELVNEVKKSLEGWEEEAQSVMENDPGESKRRSSGLFADYMITLDYLYRMAIDLGWSEEEAGVFLLSPGSIGEGMLTLVRNQYRENRQSTPGRSTLAAIRATLASGKAHILNGDDHSAAPVSKGLHSPTLATKLGWRSESDGNMRPQNSMIGYLVHNSKNEPVVLLNRDNAFGEAQKNHGALIPAGQTVTSSWLAAKDEGLLDPTMLQSDKAKMADESKKVAVRVRVDGGGQVRGVPVLLSVLLDETDDTSDEDSEA